MLDDLANLASIVTALIAEFVYVRFECRRRQKLKALENYLKPCPMTLGADDTGVRTILHLMAELRMTESEILDAAFRNPNVTSYTAVDPLTRRANCLFLRHKAR